MAPKFFRGDKVRNHGPAAAHLDRISYPENTPIEEIVREMPHEPGFYEIAPSGVIVPEGHLVLVERHPAGASAAPHRDPDGELIPHAPLAAEGE